MGSMPAFVVRHRQHPCAGAEAVVADEAVQVVPLASMGGYMVPAPAYLVS